MSFKSAIEKFKEKFIKNPEINETEKRKNILNQLVTNAEWVHSTAVKGALPCLYIYIAPSANINTVQDIYADLGIEMKTHVTHLDNKERTVLYIYTTDFMKLNKQQQEILEAPTKPGYKRQIQMSVHKTIVR